mmetsp:Transcript_4056/g.10778  ORF Transcript_4056/g.10778 Transcript_4056/m.10778 type:complete len:179 (-) Transcript_4056:97-633(-)
MAALASLQGDDASAGSQLGRRGLASHLQMQRQHNGGVAMVVLTSVPVNTPRQPNNAESRWASLPPLVSPRTGVVPENGNLSCDPRGGFGGRRAPPMNELWTSTQEYWQIVNKAKRGLDRQVGTPRGKCKGRDLKGTLYDVARQTRAPDAGIAAGDAAEGHASGQRCAEVGPLAALAGF